MKVKVDVHYIKQENYTWTLHIKTDKAGEMIKSFPVQFKDKK